MDAQNLISIKVRTEEAGPARKEGAGTISFDFNQPRSKQAIVADMARVRDFVDAIIFKHHDGEMVDDGSEYRAGKGNPWKNTATIRIKTAFEALDEILQHPFVESCTVIDPDRKQPDRLFILDRTTNKAVHAAGPLDEFRIRTAGLLQKYRPQ